MVADPPVVLPNDDVLVTLASVTNPPVVADTVNPVTVHILITVVAGVG